MSKQSKVTAVTPSGTRNSFYLFEVELEDGTIANLFKKSNNPWIEVGQEIEYDTKPARNPEDSPTLKVIKKVGNNAYPDRSGGYDPFSNKDDRIRKGGVLHVASRLLAPQVDALADPELAVDMLFDLARKIDERMKEWQAEK